MSRCDLTRTSSPGRRFRVLAGVGLHRVELNLRTGSCPDVLFSAACPQPGLIGAIRGSGRRGERSFFSTVDSFEPLGSPEEQTSGLAAAVGGSVTAEAVQVNSVLQ